MSLTTFLTKIWDEIKGLFSNMPADIKYAVSIGVTITQNIKTFVDSPAADILTLLIPGDIDDVIKEKLRQAIPALLTELKLISNTISLTSPDDITKAAIEVIRDLDPAVKPGVLHQLSILIAQTAADGKLSWADGVYLLQWYYQHEFKTDTAPTINEKAPLIKSDIKKNP